MARKGSSSGYPFGGIEAVLETSPFCEHPFESRTAQCSPSARAPPWQEQRRGVAHSRYFPAPDFLRPASVHTSERKECRIPAALVTFGQREHRMEKVF